MSEMEFDYIEEDEELELDETYPDKNRRRAVRRKKTWAKVFKRQKVYHEKCGWNPYWEVKGETSYRRPDYIIKKPQLNRWNTMTDTKTPEWYKRYLPPEIENANYFEKMDARAERNEIKAAYHSYAVERHKKIVADKADRLLQTLDEISILLQQYNSLFIVPEWDKNTIIGIDDLEFYDRFLLDCWNKKIHPITLFTVNDFVDYYTETTLVKSFHEFFWQRYERDGEIPA